MATSNDHQIFPNASAQHPADSTRHVSQKELARRWGLSMRTIERWRSKGIGPIFLKLNGRVAYRLADVETFEVERLRSSTVPMPVPAFVLRGAT